MFQSFHRGFLSFNIINTYNDFVAGIWRSLNMLLEPFYRPLRKILPNTHPFDFAPLALLVSIGIVQIVLHRIEYSL